MKTKRGEATPRTANRSSTDDVNTDESEPLPLDQAAPMDDDVATSNGHNSQDAAGKAEKTVSPVLFAAAEETTVMNDRPLQSPQTETTNEQLPKVRQATKNDNTSSTQRIHIPTSKQMKSNQENSSVKQKKKSSTRSHDKPSRKRGRPAQVVSIDPKVNGNIQPRLPANQYMATLHRRAVRKLPDGNDLSQNATNDSVQGDFGDVSLGMKLIVVGGRVIVQHLNALIDGLASPAQLAGTIQRGDVLLAINSVSLVNLPVDLLMDGLRPLSTPGPDGNYERTLSLRFQTGARMDLLKMHEEAQATTSSTRQEPAEAMFNLFPMVDQLSGAPLFENHFETTDNEENGDDEKESTEPPAVDTGHKDWPEALEPQMESVVVDLDDLIASTLAKERTVDRQRYESEYFDWKEDLSDLLRRTVGLVDDGDIESQRLTQTERLVLGKRILQMTKSLESNMEEIDKGRDLRSFKAWSTNFSLRSGVSARRRHVVGAISVRSGRETDDDSLQENDSIDSDRSGASLEDVDADTLLLGLAARDEIWRKQVLDSLEEAIHEAENFEARTEEDTSSIENKATNMNDALSQQLGHLLFGDMTKIVKHEKRSFALPPDEITRVLFDLTTNLATKTPDEITVFGDGSRISSNISSLLSATTKTDGKSKAAFRADLLLANRFVLDEALPRWLQSFRPLPLDQRRVMWPRSSRRPDTTATTFTGPVSEYTGRSSDGDTLTIDSADAETQESSPSRKKSLRELVEDQQIDSETKSETCFLVTYFFTHQIVGGDTAESIADKGTFVDRYGSYLQMHACLSFAASQKDEVAITHLLRVAKFDPKHVDIIKEINRSKNLVFYDGDKLSAVLEVLQNIRYDANMERRRLVRDLCISAYPDILPWQVRHACLDLEIGNLRPEAQVACSEGELEDLYYSYLSQLLHPFDGNDRARHDEELLEEYCEWSVGIKPHSTKKSDRIENFLNIASRSSIQHHRYKRDLTLLLKLSVELKKEDLVLDLVDEILDCRKLLLNKDAMYKALFQLQKLGSDALISISHSSKESTGFRILGRILKLFEKMTNSDSIICRDSLKISNELYTLFQKWKIQSGSTGDDSKMYLLIDFVIDESSSPQDVFRALVLWSSSNDCGDLLFPRLRALLRRGVHFAAVKGELSGTLLRLRHARGTFKELHLSPPGASSIQNGAGIWEAMATAKLSIDK